MNTANPYVKVKHKEEGEFIVVKILDNHRVLDPWIKLGYVMSAAEICEINRQWGRTIISD